MPTTGNNVVTPQGLNTGVAVVTTANTTYNDTPTNTQLLFTAGVNGSLVFNVEALARDTIAASKLQLYRSSDGGTTKRLVRTRLMAAYTMGSATAQTETDFGWSETIPLRLEAGETLYAGASVVPAASAGITFVANGEDL